MYMGIVWSWKSHDEKKLQILCVNPKAKIVV